MTAPEGLYPVESHHDRLRAILVVADDLDGALARGVRAPAYLDQLIELHSEAIAELLKVSS